MTTNYNLTRRDVLRAGAVAGLALAAPRMAFTATHYAPVARDFDTDPITVVKLTDNLNVLMGPGGNIAVLTGDDGTVQIDSGVPSRAADIAKAIAALSPRPVTTLINTHWHSDHTGGNAAVGKAGARIVAQTNTRKRLATDQVVEFFKMTLPPAPAVALPTLTFDDTLTFYANGEEMALAHVKPAHTDTDIHILFQKANVLHAGDLLFNGFYPFIDYSSGGWIGGMIAASEQIIKNTDDKTRIIPGHGPIASRADVIRYHDMLRTVRDRIEPRFKAGEPLEAVVAAKPTADLDAQWGKGLISGDPFTMLVYTGLVRHSKQKQG